MSVMEQLYYVENKRKGVVKDKLFEELIHILESVGFLDVVDGPLERVVTISPEAKHIMEGLINGKDIDLKETDPELLDVVLHLILDSLPEGMEVAEA